MQQIILSDYEQIPVLQDAAIPEPKDGEVLVRIAAAALNPLDIKLQRGQVHAYFPLSFPSAMGTDLAGTIEKTGSLTSRWRTGDRVMARLDPTKGGAFADYAIVPEDQLALVPEELDFNSAAGLPTAAGTAWQALVEMADLQAGQTVLVHAGTGGVGSFAIQFARGFGARHCHHFREWRGNCPGTGCRSGHRLSIRGFYAQGFRHRCRAGHDRRGDTAAVLRRFAQWWQAAFNRISARSGTGNRPQSRRCVRVPYIERKTALGSG
jgi:hypothetical protein